MIVAITGGSGFIGRRLVDRHIQKGDQVRLLSRKKSIGQKGVQCFLGDLSNPHVDLSDFLNDVDVLYHCAGELNNESLMFELHVNGTQILIDAAKKAAIGRWVQLSSVGAYGPCQAGVITEEAQENPCNIYEETKTESDNLVIHSDIPYVVLRPSNVFGEKMPNQSLNSLTRMVRSGLFFFIGKKGASSVNYVHVSDVVEALVLCGLDYRAVGEVFNLSQSIKVESMIESLESDARRDRVIFRLPEAAVRLAVKVLEWIPGIPLTRSRMDALTSSCVYSSAKIQKLLGFRYPKTLKERFELFSRTR